MTKIKQKKNKTTTKKRLSFKDKLKDASFKKDLFICVPVIVFTIIISIMIFHNINYNLWFDMLSIEERQEYLTGETSKLISGTIKNYKIVSINHTKITVEKRMGKSVQQIEVPAFTFVYEDNYGKLYTEKGLWISDETCSQIVIGSEDLYIVDENKICTFKYLQLSKETMKNLGIAENYGADKFKDKDSHFR